MSWDENPWETGIKMIFQRDEFSYVDMRRDDFTWVNISIIYIQPLHKYSLSFDPFYLGDRWWSTNQTGSGNGARRRKVSEYILYTHTVGDRWWSMPTKRVLDMAPVGERSVSTIYTVYTHVEEYDNNKRWCYS